MHLKTAYIRLTVYYVLIVMLISVMFSSVIYKIASFELGSGLSKQSRIFREENFGVPAPAPLQKLDRIRSEQLAESTGKLRNNLIYFNILILLLSSAGCYFLARRTLRPVEESIKSQSRFTGDASHELRTPLAAMRSETEVALRNGELTLAESKKQLQSNLEEIEKLETLSEALLKLSRYDEKEIPEFRKIDLSEAAVSAYEKVAKMADAKQIDFDNHLTPVYVYGDKGNIVELLAILLENAIKYSYPRSTISIKTFTDKKFGGVSVADGGIGIKSNDLRHIFERFYRADNSRSKVTADGYGLGLSIAKAIIDYHKGKIVVKSIPGKGSKFTALIPIVSDKKNRF